MSDTHMRSLLLQVAGFLRLVEAGFPVAPSEATELLDKIAAKIEAMN